MLIVNEEQKKELGIDGDNAMSEKEFLIGVIEFLVEGIGVLDYGMPGLNSIDEVKATISNELDKWLYYYHKSFYEVEFVKKEISDDEVIKNIIEMHKRVLSKGELEALDFVQNMKEEKEEDDYDYAADDMNYDAARERKYK